MSPLRPLVIVGAGGHGREVFATVAAINREHPTFEVLGFVDDAPRHPDRLERLGTGVLGDIGWLEAHPAPFVLALGDPEVRRSVADRLGAAGAESVTVVHPGAELGPDVRLCPGVIVFDRCTITTNVTIGRHTHLNVGCAVQHDSTIGEFAQSSPGVLVNGDCDIGDEAFLGSGAIITRGVSVGDRARVGAGAVVLDDVQPDTTVVGVPARRVGS